MVIETGSVCNLIHAGHDGLEADETSQNDARDGGHSFQKWKDLSEHRNLTSIGTLLEGARRSKAASMTCRSVKSGRNHTEG